MQGNIAIAVAAVASFSSAMTIELVAENALNAHLMVLDAQAPHQFGLCAMSFSFYS